MFKSADVVSEWRLGRTMRNGLADEYRAKGGQSSPRAMAATVATVATTFGNVTAAVGRTRAGVPHEVFLRGAAPGSDAATIVEAIARLASFALQLPSTVPATVRLQSIIEALAAIPGTRPSSPGVAGSIPSAVAAALASASVDASRRAPSAHGLADQQLVHVDGQA